MKNYKILYVLIYILAVWSCNSVDPEPEAEDISSDFETGTDNWKIEGDAKGGQVSDIDPQFSPVDGVNNSGHIFAEDDVAGGVWYFVAPSQYRGDKSAFYGASMEYYLTQSSVTNQFAAQDIIIESGDGSLLIYRYPNAAYPGVEWTKYSILLTAGPAWTDTDEMEITEAEMKRILSDITKLSIRGEFRTGGDTGRLDQFSYKMD